MQMNHTQAFRQLRDGLQRVVSKVQVCQLGEFLMQKMEGTHEYHNIILFQILSFMNFTLKMFAFIPFVLSRLWLTLRDTSLVGSIGSLTSLLSASVSSSSWSSFEKAPSSISMIRLPLRSILLSVAVKQHNMHVFTHLDILTGLQLNMFF